MKIRNVAFVVVALGVSCGLTAQTSSPETRVVRAPKTIEKRIIVRSGEPGMHGEMGKWWRDAEISKKLQLSEGQIQQLDQIFYDHRVKLIDHGAEMEKQAGPEKHGAALNLLWLDPALPPAPPRSPAASFARSAFRLELHHGRARL